MQWPLPKARGGTPALDDGVREENMACFHTYSVGTSSKVERNTGGERRRVTSPTKTPSTSTQLAA